MKGVTGSTQWILTLRNIDARDSGRYTCRVWNSAGEISFDYTLRVVGKKFVIIAVKNFAMYWEI